VSSRLRIEIPGGFYHVTANAVDGMPLFRTEEDRLVYLGLFADQARRSEWAVLGYSLMTTHFHGLMRLEKATLSSGFQRMQSIYARGYNKRHDRRGVVWQRRFHGVILESERHLFEAIRYVALNAPRAGMCQRAEDYRWCSYGSAIGAYSPDPLVDERLLLSFFGRTSASARRQLREYVEEADPRERWRQTLLRVASDARVTPRAAKRPRRAAARSS
jgi:REP element-mobilizing transposase RayT